MYRRSSGIIPAGRFFVILGRAIRRLPVSASVLYFLDSKILNGGQALWLNIERGLTTGKSTLA